MSTNERSQIFRNFPHIFPNVPWDRARRKRSQFNIITHTTTLGTEKPHSAFRVAAYLFQRSSRNRLNSRLATVGTNRLGIHAFASHVQFLYCQDIIRYNGYIRLTRFKRMNVYFLKGMVCCTPLKEEVPKGPRAPNLARNHTTKAWPVPSILTMPDASGSELR